MKLLDRYVRNFLRDKIQWLLLVLILDSSAGLDILSDSFISAPFCSLGFPGFPLSCSPGLSLASDFSHLTFPHWIFFLSLFPETALDVVCDSMLIILHFLTGHLRPVSGQVLHSSVGADGRIELSHGTSHRGPGINLLPIRNGQWLCTLQSRVWRVLGKKWGWSSSLRPVYGGCARHTKECELYLSVYPVGFSRVLGHAEHNHFIFCGARCIYNIGISFLTPQKWAYCHCSCDNKEKPFKRTCVWGTWGRGRKLRFYSQSKMKNFNGILLCVIYWHFQNIYSAIRCTRQGAWDKIISSRTLAKQIQGWKQAPLQHNVHVACFGKVIFIRTRFTPEGAFLTTSGVWGSDRLMLGAWLHQAVSPWPVPHLSATSGSLSPHRMFLSFTSTDIGWRERDRKIMTQAWKVTSFWGNHFCLKSDPYKINFPKKHSPSFKSSYGWRMGRLVPCPCISFCGQTHCWQIRMGLASLVTPGQSGNIPGVQGYWKVDKHLWDWRAISCFLFAARCSPRGHPRAERLFTKFDHPSSCQEERCADAGAPQTEPCKNPGELSQCAQIREETGLDRTATHRRFEVQLLFLRLFQCSDMPAMVWPYTHIVSHVSDSSLRTKAYLPYSIFTLLNLLCRPR